MIDAAAAAATHSTSSFLGIGFSSTISLGVILLTLAGAALAIWRTQSISALREAGNDLRKDRDDWKARYEAQVSRNEEQVVENDRQAQKIAELTTLISDLRVQVGVLQERTDTTLLAKEAVVSAFRDEMRLAVQRLEAGDAQKIDLLRQQGEMITTLITRDPALRTRADDPHSGVAK